MSSNASSSGTDRGQEKTADGARRDGSTFRPACPFCGSEDVALESTFGSEVSKSQYYCNSCHTIFERIKYDGAMPDTGRERDGTR